MIIGNQSVKIGLNENANYNLEYFDYKGTKYLSAGFFPTFMVIDSQGKTQYLRGADKSWKVTLDKKETSAVVCYSSEDITIRVSYCVQGETSVLIKVQATEEQGYKIIALTDDEGFIVIPKRRDNSNADFLVIPRGHGGELIPFSGKPGEIYKRKCKCGWGGLYGNMGLEGFSLGTYANFLAVLTKKNGVILSPLQNSADFCYGEKPLDNVQTLFLSAAYHFRPRATTDFRMPLCHKEIAFELTFVDDRNKDGIVDWVDIGIAYRDKYIKKNSFLDETVKNGMVLELDINRWVESVDQFESLQEKVQVGDDFIKELWSIYDPQKPLYPQIVEKCIKPLYFMPTVLKLVGGHVKRGQAFDQMWSNGPEPSYGSFLDFKKAAAVYHCKVLAHMDIDDVYEGDKDWETPSLSVRTDSRGNFLKGGVYGDRQSYIRDIPHAEATSAVYALIDKQFADWNVGNNDDWHWDVFTTIVGTECCSLLHPATSAMDYEARIKILKYIAETRKIHLASEGFSGGIHEYCTMGCYPPLLWKDPSESFPHAVSIPLIAVIFLGRSYYDAGCGVLDNCVLEGEEHCLWKKSILLDPNIPALSKSTIDLRQVKTPGLWARALLLGTTFRALTNLPGIEAKKEMHFKHGVFFSCICDLEVVDIDKNGADWKVKYSDGSVLRVTDVDLSDMRSPSEGGTWKGVCVYEKDGIVYDGYSPVNCRGYLGVWREGKAHVLLPKGDYSVVEGNCIIENIINEEKYTGLTVNNSGLSILRRG